MEGAGSGWKPTLPLPRLPKDFPDQIRTPESSDPENLKSSSSDSFQGGAADLLIAFFTTKGRSSILINADESLTRGL